MGNDKEKREVANTETRELFLDASSSELSSTEKILDIEESGDNGTHGTDNPDEE